MVFYLLVIHLLAFQFNNLNKFQISRNIFSSFRDPSNKEQRCFLGYDHMTLVNFGLTAWIYLKKSWQLIAFRNINS